MAFVEPATLEWIRHSPYVLALDVDQVLIDSTDEVIVSCWNEYQEWNVERGRRAGHELIMDRADVPADYVAYYWASKPYRNAVFHRVGVNLAYERGIAPAALSSGLIEQLSLEPAGESERVKTRTRRVRAAMREHPGYPRLVRAMPLDYAVLRELERARRLVYLTNNADSSHGLRLPHIGLDVVREALIAPPAAGNPDKSAALIALGEVAGRERVYFVDDAPPSLEEARARAALPDANLFWPAWAPGEAPNGFRILRDWADFRATFAHVIEAG